MSTRVRPPVLAFGKRIAQTDTCLLGMQERIATVRGWKGEYDAIGPKRSFRNTMAALNINGVKLAAVSQTPVRTCVHSPSSCSIFIPITGAGNRGVVNGERYTFEPGVNAMFAPQGERIGEGRDRSVLIIDVAPARLQATAATMLGGGRSLDFDFTSPLSLNLRIGAVALDETLLQFCAVLDQFCDRPDILQNLGMDDSINRTLLLLLKPERFLESSGKTDGTTPSKALDAACQYAMANLSHAITLTDLEHISGLSRRALQYGFLKSFNIGDALRQAQPPAVPAMSEPALPRISGAPIEPPMATLPGGQAQVQVNQFAIVGNRVIATEDLLAQVRPDQGKRLR